jgi:hypothetical protein
MVGLDTIRSWITVSSFYRGGTNDGTSDGMPASHHGSVRGQVNACQKVMEAYLEKVKEPTSVEI